MNAYVQSAIIAQIRADGAGDELDAIIAEIARQKELWREEWLQNKRTKNTEEPEDEQKLPVGSACAHKQIWRKK